MITMIYVIALFFFFRGIIQYLRDHHVLLPVENGRPLGVLQGLEAALEDQIVLRDLLVDPFLQLSDERKRDSDRSREYKKDARLCVCVCVCAYACFCNYGCDQV
jgi:hypothetical protein